MGQARREIVRLLSNARNWYQGHYSLITVEPEPTNVGFIFRRGENELVLFFSGEGFAEGSFNGQHVADPLEYEPGKEFAKWTHRYAQLELAAK